MAEVTTGIQDNSYIQILSGLKADDEVVTAPYTALTRKLEQGMKVQKVKEEDLYKEN
jgi:HlyD family secretion protein